MSHYRNASAGPRKYINKRTIQEFTSPKQLPPEIEDEILAAFANYSIEHDMTTDDLDSFYRDLRIPKEYIVGNKRLSEANLVIEGTDVVDFDQLMVVAFQLIMFRDNKETIDSYWELVSSEINPSSKSNTKHHQNSLNFNDLKAINDGSKIGINVRLLLDMVAVATEGKGVEITKTDFAYTLGKLGELK